MGDFRWISAAAILRDAAGGVRLEIAQILHGHASVASIEQAQVEIIVCFGVGSLP